MRAACGPQSPTIPACCLYRNLLYIFADRFRTIHARVLIDPLLYYRNIRRKRSCYMPDTIVCPYADAAKNKRAGFSGLHHNPNSHVKILIHRSWLIFRIHRNISSGHKSYNETSRNENHIIRPNPHHCR